MKNTIDIGIDLGTTNSVIAKYEKGEVEIFSDPKSNKYFIPSVVAYSSDNVVVGDRALEFIRDNPQSVASTFKRKMGTCDEYYIQSIEKYKSPLELSTEVLKKLRSIATKDTFLQSAVVTIPSSFDTVQANATKEAGKMAGFSNVVLLQEPIAASLAYANQTKRIFNDHEIWLVYDLGGGTFDVALIEISNGEMRMLDHEGDTLLGGKDFDRKIVENVIIPFLSENYKLSNFGAELKSASGKYNKLWKLLMQKAEQAKIDLTNNKNTVINLDIKIPDSIEIDDKINLSREQFEKIAKGIVEHTIRLSSKMLKRNLLQSDDIKFILMTGGATKTPFVGKTLEEKLAVQINTEIDPITSVAIGAAFFAGTKVVENYNEPSERKTHENISVKVAYEKNTKESYASLSATASGNIENLEYDIIREDGGYLTERIPLTPNIVELLPLEKNTYNFFRFRIFSPDNKEIETSIERMTIAQGRYNVAGQLLPEDICLEIDDPESGSTRLLLLFNKNSVLPLDKSINRLINKTIKKGSDEKFIINVLEGNSQSLPIANRTIGYMAIEGKQLKTDLHKGSDIELIFEITESRDLRITANIPILQQQFFQIFTPENRKLPVDKLESDFEALLGKLEKELDESVKQEDYENAKKIKILMDKISDYIEKVKAISEDDITDARYHFEDRKRELAMEIFNITKDKIINVLIKEYLEEKISCGKIVKKDGNKNEVEWYEKLISRERTVLNVHNPSEIQNLLDDLRDLKFAILWRIPDYLINVFEWLKSQKKNFRNIQKGKELIASAYKALETENYTWLKQVNFNLLNLLPRDVKKEMVQSGTGIL